MINIYLDDLRDCPQDFILAKTMEEAIELFNNNEVNIISLDHDLGEDDKGNLLPTGYDFVKHMCQNNLKCKVIYIHTDNPVGRENMFQTLLAARKRGFIDKNTHIYSYALVPNKYSE